MFVDRSDSARRLVISDIHGCLRTFLALMEKLNPDRNDQLFFLGDYIDRGPSSSGVIDYLLKLKADGYSTYFLKGNHEENLLNASKEYDNETFVFFVKKINKSLSLLDGDGLIRNDYHDFFRSLEYYFETDSHFIVHAGFNFTIENPFSDHVSMLELRKTDIEKGRKFIGDKSIVHGHQVTPVDEIILAVKEKRQILPIDNGCYYTRPHKIYDVAQTGNLCCLDIDTYNLVLQKNIEDG